MSDKVWTSSLCVTHTHTHTLPTHTHTHTHTHTPHTHTLPTHTLPTHTHTHIHTPHTNTHPTHTHTHTSWYRDLCCRWSDFLPAGQTAAICILRCSDVKRHTCCESGPVISSSWHGIYCGLRRNLKWEHIYLKLFV
jgi:hypothetical protein